MNSFVMTDKQRLAFAAATNVSESDAVRNLILDLCGGEWNFYKFMDNRYNVFAVLAEMMPAAQNASLAGKFDKFAEFKDVAMGDKPYFNVEDNVTYPVVTVARGVGSIDRQKITDKNFTVATEMKAIKLYDELDRFMAGKIDMGRLVEKANAAFANHVGALISDAIYDSYSAVGTNYKTTGAFAAATMLAMMEHVKAANSADAVQIWGTTTALANVTDTFGYSDSAKDGANGVGYWGEFRGASLFSLPQGYAPKAQTFSVSSNQLIVVPAGEKLVKVVFEGQAVVNMTDGMDRSDLQPEFTYGRRVGVAALTVPEGKYGLYRFA